MNLEQNLLWHLGRYDNIYVSFLELLTDKTIASQHDDIWELVQRVMNMRNQRLVTMDIADVVVPEDQGAGTLETWRRIDVMYKGQPQQRRIVQDLVHHARVLTCFTSHGYGPWKGAERLVGQFYDERKALGAIR